MAVRAGLPAELGGRLLEELTAGRHGRARRPEGNGPANPDLAQARPDVLAPDLDRPLADVATLALDGLRHLAPHRARLLPCGGGPLRGLLGGLPDRFCDGLAALDDLVSGQSLVSIVLFGMFLSPGLRVA